MVQRGLEMMIWRAAALVLAASALWFGSFEAASALPNMRLLLGRSHQIPQSFTPVAQDRARSCYETCRRNRGTRQECERECK
jgi:hypothetical protein